MTTTAPSSSPPRPPRFPLILDVGITLQRLRVAPLLCLRVATTSSEARDLLNDEFFIFEEDGAPSTARAGHEKKEKDGFFNSFRSPIFLPSLSLSFSLSTTRTSWMRPG